MSLFDELLGRTKPVKSQPNQLFAISTAYLTLTENLGLKPSERAGVTFRPITSTDFQETDQELTNLLAISGKETETKVEQLKDSFGFQWIVLTDPQFEDLVSTVHVVSLTLQEHGFRDQLLAAAFKFFQDEQPVYWIYNYKRGSFYPFAPIEGKKQRDNATELRMRSVMERELPIEKELERWYPLWDMPL
ncbi:MAG: hypothetical protein M1319_06685 [Chloroflexi bacterium]|nr:hypothetical protein [Chloroflexota bacterium]